MKILKTFDNAKLIIVELEVNMGDKKRSAPTPVSYTHLTLPTKA